MAGRVIRAGMAGGFGSRERGSAGAGRAAVERACRAEVSRAGASIDVKGYRIGDKGNRKGVKRSRNQGQGVDDAPDGI